MSNQQWEYRYDAYQMSNAQELLDAAGEDGWEAVGIAADADSYLHVLFKRPKEQPFEGVTQIQAQDKRLTTGGRAR